MIKLTIRDNSKFWRRMTHLWTLIFFAAILYDFSGHIEIHQALLPISAVYTAILATYAADKEFKRWKNCHETTHPGEVYLILWTILIFGMFISNIFTANHYDIPAEVISAYIVALGVLAITKESKKIYKNKKNVC